MCKRGQQPLQRRNKHFKQLISTLNLKLLSKTIDVKKSSLQITVIIELYLSFLRNLTTTTIWIIIDNNIDIKGTLKPD